MQKLLRKLITVWADTLASLVEDDRERIRQQRDEEAHRKRWHEYLRPRPP